MIHCPKCSELKRDHSWLCDCGYEFAGDEPEGKVAVHDTPSRSDVGDSQTRGRRALKFGAIGWLPWFVLLCCPGNPLGTAGPGNLLAGIVLLVLFLWGLLFCGIGSRIVYRRTAGDYVSLKGLWSAALLLNYGFFFCPILFFLLAPVFGIIFSSGGRPLGGS